MAECEQGLVSADAMTSTPTAECEQGLVAADAMTSTPSPALKRKRSAAKTMTSEAVAANIKELQEKANQKDVLVAKLEADIVAIRAEASAVRAEARKAAQEYARLQHEEELSKLDNSMPKRPKNAYFSFTADSRAHPELQGLKATEVTIKITEMWKSLGEDEKKAYKEKYEEESRKYKEWGDSEEGRRVLTERTEVLRKVKASEAELAEAVEAKKLPAEQVTGTPPKPKPRAVKPGASAEQVAVTPPKPKAVARTAKPGASVEPILEQKVFLEAEKAELLGQLHNLAGRPDVRALGKTDAELLAALKASGGMVNATKNILLGGQ